MQDFTIVGLSHGGEGISLLDELDERKNGALMRKPDVLSGELEISRSGGASFLASIKDMMSDSGITTDVVCGSEVVSVDFGPTFNLAALLARLCCRLCACMPAWTVEVNVINLAYRTAIYDTFGRYLLRVCRILSSYLAE